MHFSIQFQEQFSNQDVTVTLTLHPGQLLGRDTEIIPAVFIIEFLPNSDSLTSEVVTRTILSNYNNYSFEEFSNTVEPPELAEITPNGTQNMYR